MAVFKVIKYPHILLRKSSTPVTQFDSTLVSFVESMKETMYAFDGIGLAAPQVGILKQVIVIDVRPFLENESLKEWRGESSLTVDGQSTPFSYPLAIVNPQITSHSGVCKFPFDGCLSFPGVPRGETERFQSIVLEGKDERGRALRIEATGILSICLQHELDHLNGVLFVDHLKTKVSDQILIDDIEESLSDPRERRRMKKLKLVDAQSLDLQF